MQLLVARGPAAPLIQSEACPSGPTWRKAVCFWHMLPARKGSHWWDHAERVGARPRSRLGLLNHGSIPEDLQRKNGVRFWESRHAATMALPQGAWVRTSMEISVDHVNQVLEVVDEGALLADGATPVRALVVAGLNILNDVISARFHVVPENSQRGLLVVHTVATVVIHEVEAAAPGDCRFANLFEERDAALVPLEQMAVGMENRKAGRVVLCVFVDAEVQAVNVPLRKHFEVGTERLAPPVSDLEQGEVLLLLGRGESKLDKQRGVDRHELSKFSAFMFPENLDKALFLVLDLLQSR
mmetsp:Transcript_36378/g.102774  ORF Transcript_36378/g.102774 Transcript_36378/m.102774 type:complete len:298 (-) Transcript_36378:250-1143(-)